MSKFTNTRSVLTFLFIAIVLVGVLLLVQVCHEEIPLNASVTPTEVMLGEDIFFKDSTVRTSAWMWEFGNGDNSEQRSGRYSYPDVGLYQIRLRVNGGREALFLVRVKPYSDNLMESELVRIDAPQTAFVGEYVVFSGIGDDREWRWELDGTGVINAREKSAIYAYQQQGVYQVRLTTERTRYPITHWIEILPKYTEDDSSGGMNNVELDILRHLQAIADGKSFNQNYNYILTTYLRNDPDVIVNVNNTKRNDFYSYCQGLRMTGRNNTTVKTVIAELRDDAENSAIANLTVMQVDKK